jgi:hypothetical protein
MNVAQAESPHSARHNTAIAEPLLVLITAPECPPHVVALVASLLFGFIWTRVSPQAAFLTGGSLALVATGLLYLLFSHETDSRHQR